MGRYDHDLFYSMSSKENREAFMEGRTLEKVLDCLRKQRPQYRVHLRFEIRFKNQLDVFCQHAVDTTLVSGIERHTAQYLSDLITGSMTREEVLLMCLGLNLIDIPEVFSATSDDPEEGSLTWFHRHGVPDSIRIVRLYDPDVSIIQQEC